MRAQRIPSRTVDTFHDERGAHVRDPDLVTDPARIPRAPVPLTVRQVSQGVARPGREYGGGAPQMANGKSANSKSEPERVAERLGSLVADLSLKGLALNVTWVDGHPKVELSLELSAPEAPEVEEEESQPQGRAAPPARRKRAGERRGRMVGSPVNERLVEICAAHGTVGVTPAQAHAALLAAGLDASPTRTAQRLSDLVKAGRLRSAFIEGDKRRKRYTAAGT